MLKNTFFTKNHTLCCKGELISLHKPRVMGILNMTPDSFYDGGRLRSDKALLEQCEKHVVAGATFLDIGGYSTRPGAAFVSEEEELQRCIPVIERIQNSFPTSIISIDTFRSKVAKAAVEAGAALINDISAGSLDPLLWKTAAELNVPYILMHMQGRPETMQNDPQYENVTLEVMDRLSRQAKELQELGIKDIVIDPGFGFGKTIAQNYTLLQEMDQWKVLGRPVLVGLSRKSMLWKVLKSNPEKALNATTAANTIALLKGASILRVHDVSEAVEAVEIFWQLSPS